MTDYSFFANFSTMIVEWISILIFFRRVEKKAEGNSRYLGYLSLLFLFIIYVPVIPGLNSTDSFTADNLVNQVVRTTINWAAVYGYVRFTREKDNRVSAYLAALFILIYMVSFNLRQTFKPFFNDLPLPSEERLMLFLIVLIQWLLVFNAGQALDLQSIRKIPAFRWVTLLLAIVLELYFKWSLIAPQEGYHQRLEDTVLYALCSTLGVYCLILLFERNMAAQQKQQDLSVEQLRMSYEMQNAKRSLRVNTDIRRMYHDMKNHLLAIQTMTAGSEEAKQYVEELCSELSEYESEFNTGNSVADAILSEKHQRARLDGIRFNVVADLTPLDFVSTVDLVTILGNAVDNAVEAVQMLPDEEQRIVYIKTVFYANMLVLRVSNQFAGKLRVENGKLQTGKADSDLHGIGLSSIRKAAKRYGGDVETQFENNEGWFRLVVMLPLPEQNETGFQ